LCVCQKNVDAGVCCSLSLLPKGMLALQTKICMLTSLSFGWNQLGFYMNALV
jgi:hypothetical protein